MSVKQRDRASGGVRSAAPNLRMMPVRTRGDAAKPRTVEIMPEQKVETTVTEESSVFTVFDRWDGLGSHIMQAILVCLKCHLDIPKRRFAIPKDIQQSMPKMTVAHNYEKDPDFVNKTYDFIGLYRLFPYQGNHRLVASYTDTSLDTILEDVRKSPETVERYFTSDLYKRIVESWREDKHQWADRVLGRRNSTECAEFHLAMHVRRPNPCDDRIEGTTIPVRKFVPLVEAALSDRMADSKGSSFKLVLHVFSQGEAYEFDTLSKYLKEKVDSGVIGPESKVVLHLCESVFDTFVGMAMADALITSPSGLSVAAALYSQGEVYASAVGWYFALPTWKVFDTGCGETFLKDVYDASNRLRRASQVTALHAKLSNGENWQRMTMPGVGK